MVGVDTRELYIVYHSYFVVPGGGPGSVWFLRQPLILRHPSPRYSLFSALAFHFAQDLRGRSVTHETFRKMRHCSFQNHPRKPLSAHLTISLVLGGVLNARSLSLPLLFSALPVSCLLRRREEGGIPFYSHWMVGQVNLHYHLLPHLDLREFRPPLWRQLGTARRLSGTRLAPRSSDSSQALTYTRSSKYFFRTHVGLKPLLLYFSYMSVVNVKS